MAMRNLAEAQCGEGNALIKLSHHVARDMSHKQDGLKWSNPLTDDINGPYKSAMPFTPENLVNEFLADGIQPMSAAPQCFRMGTLLQEMNEIEGVCHKSPPTLGPGVAHLASQAGAWAQEYLASESFVENQNLAATWPPMQSSAGHLANQNYITPQWNQAVLDIDDLPEQLAEQTQYTNVESETAKTARKLLESVEDPKFSNTEFLKYVKQLAGHDTEGEQVKMWTNSFLDLTTNATPLNVSNHAGLHTSTLAQDFQIGEPEHIDSESMQPVEREEFWDNCQNEWNNLQANEPSASTWMSDIDSLNHAALEEYPFEEENPLRDEPNALEEGKKCLQRGLLPFAVLHFEAACQQDATCVEAWQLLGTTHAQNEQDLLAITALNKCIELDSSNQTSWMALASCYANESYQVRACHALQEWIKNDAKYQHLSQTPSQQPKDYLPTQQLREVIEKTRLLYLEAANLNDGQIDADVQTGIGVLLNVSGDYDKAADCFEAALASRPQDAQLWNKLGATLANSDRAAEAVQAYSNALDLSPGFIRCRYNLGIACLHLGANREALEHFLTTLNMQEKARVTDRRKSTLTVSSNIWSALKTCLTRLAQYQLHKAVDERDIDALNKAFQIEVPK